MSVDYIVTEHWQLNTIYNPMFNDSNISFYYCVLLNWKPHTLHIETLAIYIKGSEACNIINN